MGKSYRTIFLFIFYAALAACSATPHQSYPIHNPSFPLAPNGHHSNVQKRLLQQYERWRGTPYKMGGLSKRGIDCSGFVYITYRNVFGVKVPRTTRQLVYTGTEVARSQIEPGDLLIFKTGYKQRHVGIYVGKGYFVHASTSSGVTISNIHTHYWARAYREARRVASL